MKLKEGLTDKKIFWKNYIQNKTVKNYQSCKRKRYEVEKIVLKAKQKTF